MLCALLQQLLGVASHSGVQLVCVANMDVVCSCMDLLGPNLMFLHRILQSEKDTFATTILHCFQQYAMQGCAEPTAEADPEETSCSAKNIVEAFKTRTLDKTCAVRITALQVLLQTA